MKNVIWGTGINASRFYWWSDHEKIDFFIDNDIKKKEFYEKKVLHPNNICDWNDLFIYIPQNYYEEIVPFLKKNGLKYGINFTTYDSKISIEIGKAKRAVFECLHELKLNTKKWKNGTIFFLQYGRFENIYENLLKCLFDNGIRWNIVSIVNQMYRSQKEDLGDMNVLVGPPFLDSDVYIQSDRLCDNGRYKEHSTKKLNKIFDEHMYLRVVVKQILAIFDGMPINQRSAELTVIFIFQYIQLLIKHLHPKQIISFSSVTPLGNILAHICVENGIPIIFTHPGIIPGTLSFDIGGEMGASLPAIYARNFLNLSVNGKEQNELAKKIWQFLYESKLNRKVQPHNNIVEIINSQIDNNKRIIFFAGANDVLSHMVPYTIQSKGFHSPIFDASYTALVYLATLCRQNGWNLVFKPHPAYLPTASQRKKLPSNVILVENGDVNEIIDFSDVTITILSATSYNALIRYKPVVMLGYTQLRGKGCTYEAFEKDKIEDAIKAALEKGFTQEQQDAFLLHMAQCLKYYLYDDLQERPIRYGRPVPKSMDEFYELERLLKK